MNLSGESEVTDFDDVWSGEKNVFCLKIAVDEEVVMHVFQRWRHLGEDYLDTYSSHFWVIFLDRGNFNISGLDRLW